VDEMVRAIKTKQGEHDVAVLFVDESPFSNEPYGQRGWQRAKVKRKVHPPKTGQRKTMFGALDLESQRVYWKQAPRGNAGTVIAFLHHLHQSFSDQLLGLILDHGRRHRSKKVKAFVAKTPWLDLQPLAPYSPAYNPIERFWHGLKRKVDGCKSYKTMEEIITKIRKLIWHYNEGRLITTIRFNFTAHAELVSNS
jgi:transposase